MNRKQWITVGIIVGSAAIITTVIAMIKKASDAKDDAQRSLGLEDIKDAGTKKPPQSVNEMPPSEVAMSKKVYLKINATQSNPVNVRYSAEVNNGWHNNIIHKFTSLPKGANVGVFKGTKRDNAGHIWYGYIPNEAYKSSLMGQPYTFGWGFLRDDVAYVK